MNSAIINRIENITTLKELYDLRAEMRELVNEKHPRQDFFDGLLEIQEANYFAVRLEARIEDLEKKGYFLDKIEITRLPPEAKT
jgi:hypothetical protein